MMVADTRVWARAYLNDDTTQAQKARKALAEARSKGGVFVPLIVLAELQFAGAAQQGYMGNFSSLVAGQRSDNRVPARPRRRNGI